MIHTMSTTNLVGEEKKKSSTSLSHLKNVDWEFLAKHVDHTNLKITATQKDLEQLCKEAKHYKFASVCVQPCYVKLCSELLKDSEVKVCTVVGFPHGYNTTETKVAETKDALKNGAVEIDMVINICKVKCGDWEYIEEDIRQVVEATKAGNENNIVKVIFETDLLTPDEIIRACQASVRSSSDFIKTSTGFNGVANPSAVSSMRTAVPEKMKIKAAGGIRTQEEAKQYIGLGCSRLGMSRGVKMVESAGAPPLGKRKLDDGEERDPKKRKTSEY